MFTAPTLTEISNLDLGERLWTAWSAERTAHPARLREARATFAALAAEARRRGFLVTAEHLNPGQSVVETGTNLHGVIAAIHEDGSTTVNWGRERAAGVSGSASTRVLSPSLLTGFLSAA